LVRFIERSLQDIHHQDDIDDDNDDDDDDDGSFGGVWFYSEPHYVAAWVGDSVLSFDEGGFKFGLQILNGPDQDHFVD
jgi:hypothetical protein